MACECVSCPECGGSGTVWWTFGYKKFLGNHRCDDLDEMETCEECGGSGISWMCPECQEKEEEYQDSLDDDY